MTHTGRRYGRVILALLVLTAIGWLTLRALSIRGSGAPYVPDDAKAPEGVRIKVEVFNGTRTKGLARRATLFLRDHGFDVVGSGTNTEQRAATVVYDRSGHPDWAARVGRAMNAPVVTLPDSSRYLDVTVVLGANWRPPPLPFHP
ncbi:MAG TPA: LytR C-terminal domain-containing protein [Gemmatimonadaceae bacterium]|nr:LytR C-terminal domain-containing protein [Gemmatimonadaceae bacterium]